MPDAWNSFADDMGTRIDARKMDAPFTVTYAGEAGERQGKTGDYLAKGHDGLLRVIAEKEFEARFQRIEEPPPPPPEEHQVLQASTPRVDGGSGKAKTEGR
jgi:hypothetical protein